MRAGKLLLAGSILTALSAACGSGSVDSKATSDGAVPDAGETDSGPTNDGGNDAGPEGIEDSGIEDSGIEDSGMDASVEEDGGIDAGLEEDAGRQICESGILCGDQGACCELGNECVGGACVAACESEVRCGVSNGCCAVGDVCIAAQCTTPGSPCIDYSDCQETEFCEPVLGRCVPQLGEPACLYKPPVESPTLKLEWSWTGSTIFPAFNQVMDTPLVADLDRDGEPDVVLVSFSATDGVRAYLRALSGRWGAEKWDATVDAYQSGNQTRAASTPALGDIDGDGKIDIVAFREAGGLIAFNGDGSLKWKSTKADGVSAYTSTFGESTLGIADFDGDGTPEIFAGGVVFESTGRLRFDQGAYVGANQSTYGAVSIAADVDGDGKQELLSGRRAYTHDGSLLWDNGLVDGYPATADLDLDGTPELVVVAAGKVRVHVAKTGVLLAETTLPGTGAGGPPTVAQFEGVGGPEIASANGTAYSVLRYSALPTPALSVVWSKTTQDGSSNRTGSTVFDFNGDGIAEVLYNDECFLRAYDGPTGEVILEQQNSSNTSHEYPVVADLFGDNHTKLLVAANDFVSANCSSYASYAPRHGVFVYGDARNHWVRTRRIWNQHSYHVTNVNSDGSIPAQESVSWGPQGFNNYRQSTQGKAVFNAPDLAVSLEAVLASCPEQLGLRARVSNAGSLGVVPGVPVVFYKGVAPAGTLLGEAVTTKSLLPGGSVNVEFSVDLNGAADESASSYYVIVDGQAESLINECDESNNTGAIGSVGCSH